MPSLQGSDFASALPAVLLGIPSGLGSATRRGWALGCAISAMVSPASEIRFYEAGALYEAGQHVC
jgi:hypothetical protein